MVGHPGNDVQWVGRCRSEQLHERWDRWTKPNVHDHWEQQCDLYGRDGLERLIHCTYLPNA